MIKKLNSKKLMFAAFAVVPLIAFFTLAAFAGGPEPIPEGIEIKKGKIKGVIQIEFVNTGPDYGIVNIYIDGRCQKKDSVDSKYIGPNLCLDCFNGLPTSEDVFLAIDEDYLLSWFLPDIDEGGVTGCFRPDIFEEEAEDLFISVVRDLIKDDTGEIITAVVTMRALY